MFNLFVSKASESSGYSIRPLGYVALIGLLLVLLALVAFMTASSKTRTFSTKQLVFSAISLSLATVTNMIVLFDAPMGGSITLCSMLFIVLIGYWFGPKIGITTAIAFGVIQLLTRPTILSIPQVLFDYIFAFGSLGLSGFFANKKMGLIKGYLVSILGRLVFSTISGILFFAEYAEGANVFLYSLSYNAFYIGIEGAITLVILLMPQISKALSQVKRFALE